MERLLRSATALPGSVMNAYQMGTLGNIEADRRRKAGREAADYIADLSEGMTIDRGGALLQALSGMKGQAGGAARGGGGAGALPPIPISEAQDEAEMLNEIAVALGNADASRRLAVVPGVEMPRATITERGLENIAARELGYSPRTFINPTTITKLAELMRRGDPSVKAFLASEGMPADMTLDDLQGLGREARDYQSRIASKLASKRDKAAEVDLAGRTLLMKARLTELGYGADNIGEVAAELARLGDEEATAALKELGRPTRFGHELALAKRRSVKTIIQKHVYEGLKGKTGSGAKSESDLRNELKNLRFKIRNLRDRSVSAEGLSQSETADLKDTMDRLQVVRAQFYEVAGIRDFERKTPDAIVKEMWDKQVPYAEAFETLIREGLVVDQNAAANLLGKMGGRDVWNNRGNEALMKAAESEAAEPEKATPTTEVTTERSGMNFSGAATRAIEDGISEEVFLSDISRVIREQGASDEEAASIEDAARSAYRGAKPKEAGKDSYSYEGRLTTPKVVVTGKAGEGTARAVGKGVDTPVGTWSEESVEAHPELLLERARNENQARGLVDFHSERGETYLAQKALEKAINFRTQRDIRIAEGEARRRLIAQEEQSRSLVSPLGKLLRRE